MTFAMQVIRTGSLAAGNPSVPGSTQTASLRYMHPDQLGSVAAISNEAGAVIERLAYDPWGKRRDKTGTSDVSDTLVGLSTDRGFTEHEHLDEMGIIHMNGRLYDPLIGRFMSADPFIQAPDMLQSYNRYSYVMNNPLNLTDPSGYLSWGGFLDPAGIFDSGSPARTFISSPTIANAVNVHRTAPGVRAVDNFVVRNPWAFQIGRAAAGAWGGPWAYAGATAYYTFLTTGSANEATRAGLISLGTAYAFEWAGDYAEVNGGAGSAAGYAAHAGVGCVSSVASGGSCGAGALSAVVGYGATDLTSGYGNSIGATAGRFLVTVVAGGVASRIAGGSFTDGAQTAAYGYLFNALKHEELRGFWDVDPMGFPNGTNPHAGEAQLMVAGGAVALTLGVGSISLELMSVSRLTALYDVSQKNAIASYFKGISDGKDILPLTIAAYRQLAQNAIKGYEKTGNALGKSTQTTRLEKLDKLGK
jgi:RHS repeat-associated protein